MPPHSRRGSTSSCAPLTSAPGLLAKLRASPVRQKWSFLAAQDSSGPLPRVLWTKSSPSFTTAAGGLRSLPSPPPSSSSVPTSRVMKAFIWLAPCCRAGCSGASQASLALPAAGSMLPTIWMACRPRDGGITTVTSLPSIPCRPLSHLGQEQQRAAGARVGVCVPQVEELGGHDGRREEAEAEEAGDGHEPGVLRPPRCVRAHPSVGRPQAPRLSMLRGCVGWLPAQGPTPYLCGTLPRWELEEPRLAKALLLGAGVLPGVLCSLGTSPRALCSIRRSRAHQADWDGPSTPCLLAMSLLDPPKDTSTFMAWCDTSLHGPPAPPQALTRVPAPSLTWCSGKRSPTRWKSCRKAARMTGGQVGADLLMVSSSSPR